MHIKIVSLILYHSIHKLITQIMKTLTYNGFKMTYDSFISESFSFGEQVTLFMKGERVADILISKEQLSKL